MSFREYPQPDACMAWMPTRPMPPSMSPPSPPMVCYMPKGHDGQHSNERRPTTLSRRWDGDARPTPDPVTRPGDTAGDDDRQRAADHALADRIADVLFAEKPDDYMDAAPLLVPLVRDLLAEERARAVQPFVAALDAISANCTDCRQGLPDEHSALRAVAEEADRRG